MFVIRLKTLRTSELLFPHFLRRMFGDVPIKWYLCRMKVKTIMRYEVERMQRIYSGRLKSLKIKRLYGG